MDKTKRIIKEVSRLNLSPEKEKIAIDNYITLSSLLEKSSEDLTKEEKKDLISVVELIEFNLQEALGFPKNRNYHKYWKYLKGCTCPKLDNKELFGTDYRIYLANCPWHGDFID